MRRSLVTPASHIPLPDSPNPPALQAQTILHHSHDPVLERLVRALLPEQDAREMLCGFYADALHSALTQRRADIRGESEVAAAPRRLRIPVLLSCDQ